MQKTLLIIIDNLEIGGGQSVVLELVKNIDISRYKVVTLCYGVKHNTSIENELEKICSVEYLNINKKIGLSEMRYVLKRISEINPDIIHAHLGGVTFGLPWSIIHRKPIVITAHTIPEKAFSRMNEMQLRISLKLGKVMLVAVSENNYARCKEYFNIDDQKCRFVNNGVDSNKYYILPHDKFTFINVATHNDNKNQQMIIRAFADISKKHNNIKLILVGDGPTHDSLIKLANELDVIDKVEFTGLVSNPEKYYQNADVYIQSSHREAMPMSVLQAMMAEMPIISTNVGGLDDVVKENGYLIDDNDIMNLSKRMETLILMDKEQLSYMKGKSREIAMKYSSEGMALSYMKIFDELLSNDSDK